MDHPVAASSKMWKHLHVQLPPNGIMVRWNDTVWETTINFMGLRQLLPIIILGEGVISRRLNAPNRKNGLDQLSSMIAFCISVNWGPFAKTFWLRRRKIEWKGPFLHTFFEWGREGCENHFVESVKINTSDLKHMWLTLLLYLLLFINSKICQNSESAKQKNWTWPII